jgi:hypothetical protein
MQIKKLLFVATAMVMMASCEKKDLVKDFFKNGSHGHLKQTKTYSSEVAIKWMNMQLRLMAATTGVANVAFSRPFAYSGIALYEAVVPGMPSDNSLAGKLNGLTGLPQTEHGAAYHWPSSANAALASINRQMFPNASAVNKMAIDSLENALNNEFNNEINSAVVDRSIEFGKAVAQKVLNWAGTDGYLLANDPYTPPTGDGFWVAPSSPLPAGSTPFWGKLRVMVIGSGNNAQPVVPIAYSTDPKSDFYKMSKEVYDAWVGLTVAQTDMALYWRDVPGVTTPGHYVSILRHILEMENSKLDEAAIAYALSGIIVYDAAISSWQTKYQYHLVRPITYIRNVLNQPAWTPLLATPAHPEYSSAHAVLSAADAEALTAVFGDKYSFTDHTYDYLGMPSRSFNSFRAFAIEAGNSRLYAGIHFQPSIDAGLIQGRKVAENIINKLKFSK